MTNVAAYALGGVKYLRDFQSQEDVRQEEDILRLRSGNVALDLGAHAFHDVSISQRLCRALTVRLDEPANTQFGAAEVTHHCEHNQGQFIGSDDTHNGRSGAVARFAIVT